MQLTISIPTYNRNETLKANLRHLLPQLTSGCKLRIIDNCSPTPVEETLRPLWSEFPQVDHEIIRNRVNIGANANILRCFEECETEWMWVLSDDDTPRKDAIRRILHHITIYPDAMLLNYPFDELRPGAFVTRGVAELSQKLDPSANLPWISSTVYRAGAMLDNLKFGYQYAYSMLPHVVLLLVSLGESGEVRFFAEQIMHIQLEPPEVEQQWSHINLALGTPIVYDLPFSSAVRRQLYERLLVTHLGESISLRAAAYQLLVSLFQYREQQAVGGPGEGQAMQGRDAGSVLYYFDQICRRGFYLDARPQRKVEIAIYRTALRFPALVSLFYKFVKRKKMSGHNLQDRYERM